MSRLGPRRVEKASVVGVERLSAILVVLPLSRPHSKALKALLASKLPVDPSKGDPASVSGPTGREG